MLKAFNQLISPNGEFFPLYRNFTLPSRKNDHFYFNLCKNVNLQIISGLMLFCFCVITNNLFESLAFVLILVFLWKESNKY